MRSRLGKQDCTSRPVSGGGIAIGKDCVPYTAVYLTVFYSYSLVTYSTTVATTALPLRARVGDSLSLGIFLGDLLDLLNCYRTQVKIPMVDCARCGGERRGLARIRTSDNLLHRTGSFAEALSDLGRPLGSRLVRTHVYQDYGKPSPTMQPVLKGCRPRSDNRPHPNDKMPRQVHTEAYSLRRYLISAESCPHSWHMTLAHSNVSVNIRIT